MCGHWQPTQNKGNTGKGNATARPLHSTLPRFVARIRAEADVRGNAVALWCVELHVSTSRTEGGWRYLAPLPRPLLSVCLFGSHPTVTNTHKPMISQSHHHHHYQLTRDHYNPHSGFDAVSAPQSTAKETDHPYIYHCLQLSSYGLFWVTIHIAPAIHTLTLLFSDFLPYSTTVDATSATSWSLVVTFRPTVLVS